jgi:hypothetical protein
MMARATTLSLLYEKRTTKSIVGGKKVVNRGASKFCGQSHHAIIPLFVKWGIVKGSGFDFLDANDLFYPNSQLNFDAPWLTEQSVNKL